MVLGPVNSRRGILGNLTTCYKVWGTRGRQLTGNSRFGSGFGVRSDLRQSRWRKHIFRLMQRSLGSAASKARVGFVCSPADAGRCSVQHKNTLSAVLSWRYALIRFLRRPPRPLWLRLLEGSRHGVEASCSRPGLFVPLGTDPRTSSGIIG